MRVGVVASSVLHGGILVLALVSFATPRQFDASEQSVSVDVISESDLAKITKGDTKGKKEEPPKVVAEKVDVEKPTIDPNLKVSEKPEIAPTTASPPPPPPTPQPKAEEQKPAPAPAKAEPPPPKADEALKAEPKKEDPKPQQQAQPTPLPPKKPAPPPQVAEPKPPTDQKFDADKIAALLDKRVPQRQAATAQQTSAIASLGAPRGESTTLSQSEISAFREKVKQCWRVPPTNDETIFADILLRLNKDGTLAQPPAITGGLMNPQQKSLFDAFASSAIRALIQCQPYTMFKPEKYETWKELESSFKPNMFGGA